MVTIHHLTLVLAGDLSCCAKKQIFPDVAAALSLVDDDEILDLDGKPKGMIKKQ
jgi:hypothetical protein